ncbi:hypothetical protein [Saccharibacillus alkalitolerans]|nr:hypothetical protein [Saccharibacillus alkalitolerans]
MKRPSGRRELAVSEGRFLVRYPNADDLLQADEECGEVGSRRFG